jgi:hypothetical protein
MGIIFSYRWISSHRSLMRGQLPSFPYLTWLSLPFQCFSFIVVFCHVLMFFWHRDIRFVPVPGFKLCKMGVFVDGRRETRRIFSGVRGCCNRPGLAPAEQISFPGILWIAGVILYRRVKRFESILHAQHIFNTPVTVTRRIFLLY